MLAMVVDKYEEISTSMCEWLSLYDHQWKKMKNFKSVLSALPGLLAVCNATTVPQIISDPVTACANLGASLSIENVTVNFATYLPAGSNITLTQDYNLSACGYTSQVISNDTCRLAMYVATSNQSGITLEAWLPTNWTGRFLSTGNGGVSGCIQYPDLAYAAGMGFATVGEWGVSESLGFACFVDKCRRK